MATAPQRAAWLTAAAYSIPLGSLFLFHWIPAALGHSVDFDLYRYPVYGGFLFLLPPFLLAATVIFCPPLVSWGQSTAADVLTESVALLLGAWIWSLAARGLAALFVTRLRGVSAWLSVWRPAVVLCQAALIVAALLWERDPLMHWYRGTTQLQDHGLSGLTLPWILQLAAQFAWLLGLPLTLSLRTRSNPRS